MTQFISSPTHEDGRILDLLLCNAPTFVTNVGVLEKNQVCKSGHFAIKFSISLNTKRIKCPKRKLYNYKKANWNQLNNDIRHVKWDRILKGRNAQSQWNIFSHILGKLCDVNIPKITIKSHSQPPWFDSDVHNMCLKKERAISGSVALVARWLSGNAGRLRSGRIRVRI